MTVTLKPTTKSGGGISKKVVVFPKTPFAAEGVSGVNRTRLEGGGGGGETIIQTNVGEPIPITTRWSDMVDICTEIRSPFVSTGIPEEELYMITKLRDEALDLRKKEDDERDRLALSGTRSTAWR